MEMKGEQLVPASQADTWAALNDPEILKACIPGCESIEMLSPTEMKARVALKLGPIKASFAGQVTLSNIDPPNGYTISGEGSGGSAGGAKGSADVRLVPDGDGSLLSYRVNSQVTGKIAQLGARLVDSAAQKLAGDFFAKFNQVVQQMVAPAAQPSAPIPMAANDDRMQSRDHSWRWFIAFAIGTSALLAWVWFSSH